MRPTTGLEIISKIRSHNGFQCIYQHPSTELNCNMRFSLYIPTTVMTNTTEKFDTLFYLSGLTCTEENFIQKSGFQQYANKHQFLVVGPDTSPRGLNLPGEKDTWEFGESAGWYVDAVKKPWSDHYKMYTYITKELPDLIKEHFQTSGTFGIFGHSMGGHGAIVCGLRNPELFKSISALAPVSNPMESPWGRDKAFKEFLGENNYDQWVLYDSTQLIKNYNGPQRDILVDQGSADDFLDLNLKPQTLKDAAARNPNKINLTLRMQEGYNHSYFFVSTFIGDHFEHHAKQLRG